MSNPTNILSLLQSDDPQDVREGAHLAGEERMDAAIPDLVRQIASSNIGVQEAVDRALRKIGGRVVVNAVIPLLRSDDAPVRNLAMDLLRELGNCDFNALNTLLTDDDPDIRIFAADILGAIGTVMAVPPLCRALLHDPEVNVRYQAAVSLGGLAFPEAAPSLNKALHDEEWVQFAVIESLTKIRAESSVQALLQALEHSTDLVASMIVDALGEMGNMKAIPLLLKKLNSAPTPLCNKVVRAVIQIMGEESLTLLGAKACERLRGYMVRALEDEETEVQDAAVRGFAAIGGDNAVAPLLKLAGTLDAEKEGERVDGVINALVRVSNTADLETAVRGAEDLPTQIATAAFLRIAPARAVDILIDSFWERNRDFQRYLIMELAGYAEADKQDFFLDVLDRHVDSHVLCSALLFIGRKGQGQEAEDSVIRMLSHPHDDVKETALEAAILLHSPRLEDHFLQLMHSESPLQRMMAVYALSRFDMRQYMTELTAALRDPAPEVRKVAVEAFGNGCELSETYLDLLAERMSDDSQDVRMAVVDTLGSCTDERLQDVLLQGLNDPAPWVQVRCIEHIGEHHMTQAVDRLVALLADENQLILVKSIEALGKIGGEAAFRALLPLLDHPDRDLQEAAEAAVDSIRRQAGE